MRRRDSICALLGVAGCCISILLSVEIQRAREAERIAQDALRDGAAERAARGAGSAKIEISSETKTRRPAD
jgi:hypothetical protein